MLKIFLFIFIDFVQKIVLKYIYIPKKCSLFLNGSDIFNVCIWCLYVYQENSRLYGGRQIHPFFSSRKTVKSTQERTDEESNWSPVNKKGKSFTFSPIHVFEQVKVWCIEFPMQKWLFVYNGILSYIGILSFIIIEIIRLFCFIGCI